MEDHQDNRKNRYLEAEAMTPLIFPTSEQWNSLIDLGIVGDQRQLTLVCPRLNPDSLALLRRDDAEDHAVQLGTGDGEIVTLEIITSDDHFLIETLRSDTDEA